MVLVFVLVLLAETVLEELPPADTVEDDPVEDDPPFITLKFEELPFEMDIELDPLPPFVTFGRIPPIFWP